MCTPFQSDDLTHILQHPQAVGLMKSTKVFVHSFHVVLINEKTTVFVRTAEDVHPASCDFDTGPFLSNA